MVTCFAYQKFVSAAYLCYAKFVRQVKPCFWHGYVVYVVKAMHMFDLLPILAMPKACAKQVDPLPYKSKMRTLRLGMGYKSLICMAWLLDTCLTPRGLQIEDL